MSTSNKKGGLSVVSCSGIPFSMISASSFWSDVACRQSCAESQVDQMVHSVESMQIGRIVLVQKLWSDVESRTAIELV